MRSSSEPRHALELHSVWTSEPLEYARRDIDHLIMARAYSGYPHLVWTEPAELAQRCAAIAAELRALGYRVCRYHDSERDPEREARMTYLISWGPS